MLQHMILAHHDEMNQFDVLNLGAVTTVEHVMAFCIYGLLLLALAGAVFSGVRFLQGRLLTSREDQGVLAMFLRRFARDRS